MHRSVRMPFRRTANALVSKAGIHFDQWMDELRQNASDGAVSKDYVGRIAKNVLRKCDPKQYLLSHATIVASVDTYAPKSAKTGRHMDRGVQVDVRWPNFRIKPVCQSIINNNGDAWERSLLLSSYRTFIGAPNYLEHIQIPELSKGFIVDAIARDLGDTCYVDILVATDRKHKNLVGDISSGAIDSMSMGCISLFTVCTRCGNVATDDTQLCPHVLYDGKNTNFLDEDQTEHRLAELIGHVTVQNSNQFIEASWVRNPAFTGAQRRNILNPDMAATAAMMDEASVVYEIRRDEIHLDGLQKVASLRFAEGEEKETPSDEEADMEAEMSAMEEEGGGDDAGGDEEAKDASGDDASGDDASGVPGKGGADAKLEDLLSKAQEMIVETLVKGLSDKLAPKPEDVGTATPAISDSFGGANLNESLLSASSFTKAAPKAFKNDPKLVEWAIAARRLVASGHASSLTPRDLIVLSWIDDTARLAAKPANMYMAAMNVGPSSRYPSEVSYLAACRIRMGRRLAQDEKLFFSKLGKIASVSVKF